MTPSKKRLVLALLFVFSSVLGLWFLGFFHTKEIHEGEELTPFVVLPDASLEEISGLVASKKHEGILWAHSDSGNSPKLFAISEDGRLQAEMKVTNASLRDWEAVARCEDKLYITEMGNNLNASKKLGVYQLSEPSLDAEEVEAEKFIPLRYPDQTGFPPTDSWHFDCEAVFCLRDRLYFVTKDRPAFRLFVQRGDAHLYSFDPKTAGDDNVLSAVDEISNLGGWVTAADVSEDERFLAILCESPQQSIWLLELPDDSERLFSESKSVRRFKFYKGGQLESLAFSGDTLYTMNEDREFFRLGLDKFEVVKETK